MCQVGGGFWIKTWRELRIPGGKGNEEYYNHGRHNLRQEMYTEQQVG